MPTIRRDAGSYRDPRGFVFERDGEIFRSVSAEATADLDQLLASNCYSKWRKSEKIVDSVPVEDAGLHENFPGYARFVRHSRIPAVSYPYEWPFELLKRAALLHLDLQIDTLAEDMTLSDASAYNIQFDGVNPVFIDILSFRKYHDGEIWAGQQQFLRQFLNPLLLQSLFGIAHNEWYRGAMEGIDSAHLAAIMPLSRKFSFNIQAHVMMPARAASRAGSNTEKATQTARQVRLPRRNFDGLLRQMRDWISRLEPKSQARTTWQDYDKANTYDDAERAAKNDFITRFCDRTKPGTIVDIGCNTGEYSEAALNAGASRAIGFDFDQGALGNAIARATERKLKFTPFFLDATNPSAGQGWRGTERKPIGDRVGADAVLALAVEHHLAIARNIPLDDAVDWLTGWAPAGVIEFVPKADPTVQIMLALREDIFPDYTQDAFEQALKSRARIIDQQTVSSSGRILYAFEAH